MKRTSNKIRDSPLKMFILGAVVDKLPRYGTKSEAFEAVALVSHS